MKKALAAVVCGGVFMLCCGCGAQTTPQTSAQDHAGPVLETTTVDHEEYYLLTTEEELRAIGKQYPLSGSYILGNDITLSEEWTPIGSPAEPFTGIFDGNGYSIDHLTVTKKIRNMGFFGAAKGAVIKNVVLKNADIVSLFPIVYYARDTEITGCSINAESGAQSDPQQSGPPAYSFAEEEEMIERLICAGYQDMPLSEFRALALDVFQDAGTLDAILRDLEDHFEEGSPEARMIAYTLPATCSELLSEDASGTFADTVETERTAGRVILDTLEFGCNAEYRLIYTVSEESLTVSERDTVLAKIHDQMQEYLENADKKALASAQAGDTVGEQLRSVIEGNRIEGMRVDGTLTNVSILDDSGEYRSTFEK